jgi:hypothetical protein
MNNVRAVMKPQRCPALSGCAIGTHQVLLTVTHRSQIAFMKFFKFKRRENFGRNRGSSFRAA